MSYDLDVGIIHCEGCGCLTASPHGLCSRCTDDEATDRDFWRPVRVADPYGVKQ